MRDGVAGRPLADLPPVAFGRPLRLPALRAGTARFAGAFLSTTLWSALPGPAFGMAAGAAAAVVATRIDTANNDTRTTNRRVRILSILHLHRTGGRGPGTVVSVGTPPGAGIFREPRRIPIKVSAGGRIGPVGMGKRSPHENGDSLCSRPGCFSQSKGQRITNGESPMHIVRYLATGAVAVTCLVWTGPAVAADTSPTPRKEARQAHRQANHDARQTHRDANHDARHVFRNDRQDARTEFHDTKKAARGEFRNAKHAMQGDFKSNRKAARRDHHADMRHAWTELQAVHESLAEAGRDATSAQRKQLAEQWELARRAYREQVDVARRAMDAERRQERQQFRETKRTARQEFRSDRWEARHEYRDSRESARQEYRDARDAARHDRHDARSDRHDARKDARSNRHDTRHDARSDRRDNRKDARSDRKTTAASKRRSR